MFITKQLKLLAVTAVLLCSLMPVLTQAKASAAVSFGAPFDCDNNAVINCGAPTTNTIVSAYNNQSSVRDIYSAFGIQASEISSLGDTAVAGTVTKSGDVYVGNQLVATNVVTAGRETIPGSTEAHFGNTTFFKRAPSVSFHRNALTAYVVLKDGQFQFALLSACGNPVTGTPVPPKHAELVCKQLLLTPGDIDTKSGDQAYTVAAEASVSNGSISSYDFDLGNSKSKNVTSSQTSVNAGTVTYAPGTYHLKVTVSGVAGDQFTVAPASVTCTGEFTVKPPTPPVCTTQETNGICGPTCKTPSGQVFPAGSSECTPPPVVTTTTPPATPPTSLPNTGPGSTIGLLMGVVVAGASGYQLYRRKFATN